MGRSTASLGRAMTLLWVALVVVCLLAGWTLAAIIVLLVPVLIGLVSLVGFVVYWHRHPQHRRIGAWFNEAHHLRHW
jgi:cell division protein FtsW (lipid II flippase)